MSSDGKRAIRGSAEQEPSAGGGARGLSTGWTVFSYLVAGMLAYGAIGWLIGRAVHVGLLFPIGMLVGLAISIGYIIYRFGARGAQGGDRGDGSPRSRGVPGGSSPRGQRSRAGPAQKEMIDDR